MKSNEALEKLKGEVRKGATFCAHLALAAFFEMEGSDNPVEIAGELLRAKPEMAPIVHIAVKCLEHFEGKGTREEWIEACRQMERQMEEAPKRIAKWMADNPETGKRVMTCSYSDTVFESLLEVAKERSLEVSTTEGRPLCEGTLLAKRLSYAGLPVRLGVDAAALTLLEGCDAVWIGADAVGEEFFVNYFFGNTPHLGRHFHCLLLGQLISLH